MDTELQSIKNEIYQTIIVHNAHTFQGASEDTARFIRSEIEGLRNYEPAVKDILLEAFTFEFIREQIPVIRERYNQ